MLSPRAAMTVEAEENLVRASLGRMMLTTDGDEHNRQRAPFERPFRMREVGELFGDAIAAEADMLLDELAPLGALRARRGVRGAVRGPDDGPSARALARRRPTDRRFLLGLRRSDGLRRQPRAAAPRRRRTRGAECPPARRSRALPPCARRLDQPQGRERSRPRCERRRGRRPAAGDHVRRDRDDPGGDHEHAAVAAERRSRSSRRCGPTAPCSRTPSRSRCA